MKHCIECAKYNSCERDEFLSNASECDAYEPMKKRGRPKKECKLSRVSCLPEAVKMSLESASCELIKQINALENELSEKAKEISKYKHDLQEIQEFLLGSEDDET